jgi:flagellar biosynthesis protein FliQ
MTPESAVHIFRQALLMAALLCAPLLLVAFVVGIVINLVQIVTSLQDSVVINLVQIVTSLQDSAFSTIPRLVAFLVGFILLLPWMANQLMTYTVTLFGDFARHAR